MPKRTNSDRLSLEDMPLVVNEDELTDQEKEELRAATEIMQPIVDMHAEIAREKIKSLGRQSRKPDLG